MDDARAALLLYQKNQRNWEREFAAAQQVGGKGGAGGKGKGTAGVGSKGVLKSDDDGEERPTKRGKKAKKKGGGDEVGSTGGLKLGKVVNLFAR